MGPRLHAVCLFISRNAIAGRVVSVVDGDVSLGPDRAGARTLHEYVPLQARSNNKLALEYRIAAENSPLQYASRQKATSF